MVEFCSFHAEFLAQCVFSRPVEEYVRVQYGTQYVNKKKKVLILAVCTRLNTPDPLRPLLEQN